jgi:hypothetical protein
VKFILRSLALGAAALAILVTAVTGVTTARRVVLIAQSEISVAGYPDPNRNNFPRQEKLTRGQQAKVLSCDQLKSYRAVHVRLDSGTEGYVIDGKYTLKRYSLWSNVASPISFSCPDGWPRD